MRTRIAAVLLASTLLTPVLAAQHTDTDTATTREAAQLRAEAEALLVQGEDLARRGHEREAAETFERAEILLRQADRIDGGPVQSQPAEPGAMGPQPSADHIVRMTDRLAELGDEREAERTFQEAKRFSEERERLMIRLRRAERELSEARARNRDDQAPRFEQELTELRTRIKDLDDSLAEIQNRAAKRLEELEAERIRNMTPEERERHLAAERERARFAERERHLREAVEHLHAAGMHDMAELVEREGWDVLHGRHDPRNPHGPRHRYDPREQERSDVARRTVELTERVERLEHAIHDMRRVMDDLARDLRRNASYDRRERP